MVRCFSLVTCLLRLLMDAKFNVLERSEEYTDSFIWKQNYSIGHGC